MIYDFVRELGKGGFAKVDVVCRTTDCKQFAQKTYQPSESLLNNNNNEDLKKRFIREVKYQKSFDHLNIVPIEDAFLEENPPRFIMPLAICTLRDELTKDPTLNNNPLIALFDILAGLEYLHSNGYIHRDLKPANVLKFKIDDRYVYALADFGLITAANSDSSTLTATNANGGTENYAAPELIGGFRRATRCADIYSFGAILHDIFGNAAQRIPYTELSLPGKIGEIIKKCTRTLPVRRYSDIAQLREELYQFLSSEQVYFNSNNEELVVNALNSHELLSDEQWDSVFIQIDRNLNDSVSIDNIIAAISIHHIDSLKDDTPDLFKAMGTYFVECISDQSFSFEYCDILATKLERFYSGSDLELKAKAALCMLYLGTSHNRFYVERKAKKMLDQNISVELAERLRNEILIYEIPFNMQINHLCESINAKVDFLHPVLRELL